MKQFAIISLISLSFLLASCTQMNDSISPVSPVLSKTTTTTGSILPSPGDFPFPMYTAFKSADIKYWKPGTRVNRITVELTNSMPEGTITFAVITYISTTPVTSAEKEMVFLNSQSGNIIDVPVAPDKKVQNVAIYGATVISNQILKLYPFGQKFGYFKAENWKPASNNVTVLANDNIAKAQQVYTEITYKDHAMLVFMQKPANSVFSVPVGHPEYISGINLYGLTDVNSVSVR